VNGLFAPVFERRVSEVRKAIDEAVRVLRPGGRLVIADIFSTHEYRQRLTELQMADITTRSLG
jgi:ubiquinone/menaquinone biosynthesis C-methylase UbiE